MPELQAPPACVPGSRRTCGGYPGSCPYPSSAPPAVARPRSVLTRRATVEEGGPMADQAIRRALISVSDKTGLVELAPRARRARRRDPLDRRHGQGPEGGRRRRHRHRRAHRLSRDDGRPRQDAASQGARRPARHPRQRRAHAARPRRTASRRSICWSSISIPSRRPSPRAPPTTTASRTSTSAARP